MASFQARDRGGSHLLRGEQGQGGHGATAGPATGQDCVLGTANCVLLCSDRPGRAPSSRWRLTVQLSGHWQVRVPPHCVVTWPVGAAWGLELQGD